MKVGVVGVVEAGCVFGIDGDGDLACLLCKAR